MFAATFALAFLCSLVSALPADPESSFQPSLFVPEPYAPAFNISIDALALPNASLSYNNVDCFNATTALAFPLDPDDCDNAIELLFHDPSGVMNVQQFSHHAEAGGFGTPADWHDGRCQVLLTSGLEGVTDKFRLVDVIVAAQRIIAECPPKSKTSLGGLSLVGNMKGFFVAVNGPEPLGVAENWVDGNASGVEGWWDELRNLGGVI
ncbi:hypothetical protein P7C71_g2132, partial [Lecanoromycetidae sp. Uapishka_2]